ncbi:MAG: dTDP-glucose 4,6-dehydratase [Phycisphaerales bacterium]|nr:dTDP-glucose 4,6-dehydratase [Phycisphaerales bacterium]
METGRIWTVSMAVWSSIRGDIADPDMVDRVMPGCAAVLNFAAESHVDRSLLDSRPFVHTNVVGTQVLLDAARRHGVQRFLHVSTDEVYGDLVGTDHRSVESDAMQPRSPYAASKAAAEHLVQAAHVSGGLDTVVTRGSNTYGPRQFPEKIVPLFITNALQDKPLPIYGDGGAVRDYMHVDDHCAGIDLVLRKGRPGGVYNLGAQLERTGLQVAESVLRTVDKPQSLMQFVEDRPGHDLRYAIDPSAAESLGWRATIDFDAGLAQTVDWYTNNPRWWQAIRSDERYLAHESRWYGPDRST